MYNVVLFTAGKAVSVLALVLEIKRVAWEIKLFSFLQWYVILKCDHIKIVTSSPSNSLINLHFIKIQHDFTYSPVKTKFIITSEFVDLYYTTIQNKFNIIYYPCSVELPLQARQSVMSCHNNYTFHIRTKYDSVVDNVRQISQAKILKNRT